MPADVLSASLRDRFFALRTQPHARDATPAPEAEALRAEIEATHAPATTQLDGLALSYFPTARFRLLRFVVLARIEARLQPLFARPSAAQPELAAAFVDPEELSYRSFENIIELDPLFAKLARARAVFGAFELLAEGIYRAPLHVSARTRTTLEQLDTLELYAPPLNPRARGGRRFIFHSETLAQRLTRALRKVLPEQLLAGFSHVNPVLRCNRFAQGDARFAPHIDSPYVDPARNQISKYSLLLYITGGRGESLLRFGEALALDEIESMSAIIFSQDLEHDGGPFDTGDKLFLRTELIYDEPALQHRPQLARTFARACYLSTHSLLEPELERYAEAAYNHAAAARWHARAAPTSPEPLLLKHFRGAAFMTNGYDYWFKRGSLPLRQCAALALFDLLNVKIGEDLFRRSCKTKTFTRRLDARTPAWIAKRLSALPDPSQPVFAALDKRALFPPLEQPDDAQVHEIFGTMSEFEFEDFPDEWDPRRNAQVLAHVAKQRDPIEPIVAAAPVLIMGQELFIDPERFIVEGDKLHILSHERLAPVHFAGGISYYDITSFARIAFAFDAPALLLPPICWREQGELLHLSLDLFRNGAAVHYETRDLEILEPIDSDDYRRPLP